MAIDEKTGYYSLRSIWGYNATYNFILSGRGIGKTFGIKKFLVEQDNEFVCLYRDEYDMLKSLETWVDSLVMAGYDREEFTWDGDKHATYLFHNGTRIGWFLTLTEVNHIKQMQFPEDNVTKHCVGTVFFDEFIPLVKKKLRGVSDEAEAIRAICKTIDHDTEHPRTERGFPKLRVILCANPFTWDNQILSGFKVIPKGFGITKICPEIVVEVIEAKTKKKCGFDVEEFLGDEVHRNMGFMEQTAFVKKLPKYATPYMSIRIGDHYYTAYKTGVNMIHVKSANGHKHIQGKFREMKYGSLDGLKEDEYCLNGTQLVKAYKNQLYAGKLMFNDINTKFRFMNDLETL